MVMSMKICTTDQNLMLDSSWMDRELTIWGVLAVGTDTLATEMMNTDSIMDNSGLSKKRLKMYAFA